MFQNILFFISSAIFTLFIWYLIRVTLIYRKFYNQFLFTVFSFFGAYYMVGQLLLSEAFLPDDILFYHKLKMVCIYIVVPVWILTMYRIYVFSTNIPYLYLLFSFIIILTTPFDIFLKLPTRILEQELFGIEFRYGFATKGLTYSLWSGTTMVMFVYTLVKIVITEFNFRDKVAGIAIFTTCIMAALNDFLNSYGTISSIMVIEYFILLIIIYVVAYFLKDEFDKRSELEIISDQLFKEKMRIEKHLEITEVYTKPSIIKQIKQ